MEKTIIMDLIAFRKELHQHPEVSQNEIETQKRIISFLEQHEIDGIEVGITGVMVIFDSVKQGKTIMLRSDHDALPIQEINDFEHKSLFEGVSHKCGHDGHTTIMCGVAKHLKDNPISNGKVILLFQPAEENGEGAKAVLADTKFDFNPDLVFALHNLPKYPLHTIVCREGSFTAAAKSIIIKLDGKTSHAAEPELGINPAGAISDLVKMFEKVSQPDLNKDDFALTSPIYIHMGELSYGVTAGHGEIHYTLRTWNNETMNNLCKDILNRTDEIVQNYGLKSTISWTEEFSSNQNHPDAVKLIQESIGENKLEQEERTTPFKWGEDFGLFTEKHKGAMFGIGSGVDCPALHNPDYDFPDEIIPTGINMFTTIIAKALND